MNLPTFALFFPQSMHWVGSLHLLVTDIELFGRKLINIFSPHDRRFALVEPTI